MANSKSNSRTGSLKSFSEAAGATKGLRRFGQSIKRVVREVKEESNVSESRDTLVDRYNRATYATRLLEETYQISISNLVTLHNNYMRSKEVKNLFNRYTLLRDMIKDAVKLESSWWAVAELPKQNRAESIQDYVLRVCSVLETLRMPFDASGGFQESEKEKEARLEKVNEMTSMQLQEENVVLFNNLYRLLKKYVAIRQIIKTLSNEYADSKLYPMFPRYNLLKDMIKEVTHHPDYMEHRHESRVQPD
ncbi:uncharacterized protein LOC131891732 [Tigriopus californicus]|uniref:uncharacterized protein LOC131891732 n=1 Tax=Tigriopus californicus TaxID=6832 RepID=UPI0027DA993F|nr:uncharacterized protein LOC131891732 [Tigriopus californicus]